MKKRGGGGFCCAVDGFWHNSDTKNCPLLRSTFELVMKIFFFGETFIVLGRHAKHSGIISLVVAKGPSAGGIDGGDEIYFFKRRRIKKERAFSLRLFFLLFSRYPPLTFPPPFQSGAAMNVPARKREGEEETTLVLLYIAERKKWMFLTETKVTNVAN